MIEELDVVIDNVEDLLKKSQKLQLKYQDAFNLLDNAIFNAIGDESDVDVAMITDDFIHDVVEQLRNSKGDLQAFNRIMIMAFKVATKVMEIIL